MLAKTNIEQMKLTAKLLLDIEPIRNKEFGWIVHHPIISDSHQVFVNKETNIPEMVDIFTPEGLEKVKAQYRELIDKVKSAGQFFMIINKPYSGIFFKLTKDFMNEEDYTMMLRTLWTLMEYPNADKNVSKDEWISYWKKVNLELIYDEEDKKVIDGLPDEFYVYRGLMPRAKKNALSWTIDKDKAIWFAKRFEPHGKVYRAKAKKKDILVYLSDRMESEIVIDYRKLKGVEEIEYED